MPLVIFLITIVSPLVFILYFLGQVVEFLFFGKLEVWMMDYFLFLKWKFQFPQCQSLDISLYVRPLISRFFWKWNMLDLPNEIVINVHETKSKSNDHNKIPKELNKQLDKTLGISNEYTFHNRNVTYIKWIMSLI